MALQHIRSLDQVVVLKSVDAPRGFTAHKLLGPSSCPVTYMYVNCEDYSVYNDEYSVSNHLGIKTI